LHARLGGRQSTFRFEYGICGELDGALEEGCRGCRTAAGPRPVGGSLQLARDCLVKAGCRLRQVSGATIGFGFGVSRQCQCVMDPASVLEGCRSVGG